MKNELLIIFIALSLVAAIFPQSDFSIYIPQELLNPSFQIDPRFKEDLQSNLNLENFYLNDLELKEALNRKQIDLSKYLSIRNEIKFDFLSAAEVLDMDLIKHKEMDLFELNELKKYQDLIPESNNYTVGITEASFSPQYKFYDTEREEYLGGIPVSSEIFQLDVLLRKFLRDQNFSYLSNSPQSIIQWHNHNFNSIHYSLFPIHAFKDLEMRNEEFWRYYEIIVVSHRSNFSIIVFSMIAESKTKESTRLDSGNWRLGNQQENEKLSQIISEYIYGGMR